MDLFDQSTYPPSVPPCSHVHTCTVPPSTPTAFTGSPDSIGWMVPAVLVLAVVGAAILRFTRRAH